MNRQQRRAHERAADKARAAQARTGQERSCGDCTLCCTLLGVPELLKPAGTPCASVCSTGCSRYVIRPPSCREYACLWRKGWGPEYFRPDQLGVIFDVEESEHVFKIGGGAGDKPQIVVARAENPEAFLSVAFMQQRIRFVESGVVVITIGPEFADVYGPKLPIGHRMRAVRMGDGRSEILRVESLNAPRGDATEPAPAEG